jgi:Fe-S oxidoreductase
MKAERRPVVDPGMDEAAKNLTPEMIEEVITRVLEKEVDPRFETYIETCIHCGLCSEACHYFLSYRRDPSYAPVAKVRQTLWDLLKRDGRVDGETVKKYARIAYTECNLCRRCSMYCPFGIDIAYLMSLVRRICGLLQVAPLYLQDNTNSHIHTLTQSWVGQDDYIDTLQFIEEELRMDIRNARIPLDKAGAEIMYTPHSHEVTFKTQIMANIARILNVAGVDWTMPSADGWENTNQAMHAGYYETMGMIERKHFEAALKLRVRKILSGECGHAFRAAVYDGTRWLGWKNPPVTYVAAVQFFYELIRDGRIKIAKKIQEPVTVQDPCSIVRNRGLGEMLRSVIKATCDDFRDVTPRLEHNYCCCAGGGVINYGPLWKFIRMEGGRIKVKQLMETGAKVVIAPCHSCHKTIEEMSDYYKLGLRVLFVNDLLVETMEIPEELRAGSKAEGVGEKG